MPDPTPDSTQDEARRTRIAGAIIAALPHAAALGMALTEIGAGRAVISMAYDPRFVGDPDAYEGH